MKTITFTSNFGRFAYRVEAKIGDEVNDATTNLAIRGMADTAFRGVASEVEKALVKAELSSKETKRQDIEYSAEAAKIVETTAQAKLDTIAKDAKLPVMTFQVTGEHVYGEAGQSTTKEAQAVVDAAKAKKTLALLAEKVGADASDEKAVVIAVAAKLREVRAQAAATAKAALEL